MKKVETIIIGGGMAGLGCAERLTKNKKDFLLISENIGGRVKTSEDGLTNYGAFYVYKDYKNLNKYVRRTRRVKLNELNFHKGLKSYKLFGLKSFSLFPSFLKFTLLLYQFKMAYKRFRKKSYKMSHKRAIESEKLLYKYYMQEATDFIKENRLEKFFKEFLTEPTYSITFSKATKINTFSFLQNLLPLIIPIHTFILEKERLIAPFNKKIIQDSLKKIKKKNKEYIIKTKSGEYCCKNLVLATPIWITRKFIPIKKINNPVKTHVFHISGEPREFLNNGEGELFHYLNKVQAFIKVEDGTYLLYHVDAKPPFEKFFKKYSLIKHHFWNPAAVIGGHTLIEANLGNNLYLAGDFNAIGMEDSFITGIYAANQIIKNSK